MKYATALIALAATAIAVPTNGGGQGGKNGGSGGGGGTCNTNQNAVCCNGFLGGIVCNIGILGTGCNSGSYCCDSSAQQVSFIRLLLISSLA